MLVGGRAANHFMQLACTSASFPDRRVRHSIKNGINGINGINGRGIPAIASVLTPSWDQLTCTYVSCMRDMLSADPSENIVSKISTLFLPPTGSCIIFTALKEKSSSLRGVDSSDLNNGVFAPLIYKGKR